MDQNKKSTASINKSLKSKITSIIILGTLLFLSLFFIQNKTFAQIPTATLECQPYQGEATQVTPDFCFDQDIDIYSYIHFNVKWTLVSPTSPTTPPIINESQWWFYTETSTYCPNGVSVLNESYVHKSLMGGVVWSDHVSRDT